MIKDGIYTLEIHKTKSHFYYQGGIPHIADYTAKKGYFWQRTVVSPDREIMMIFRYTSDDLVEAIFLEEAALLKEKIAKAMSLNRIMNKEKLEIESLKNLVRFLCQYQGKLNDLRSRAVEVYPKLESEKIREMVQMEWPIIQGLRNQISLKKIGEQSFDQKLISDAVKIMLGDSNE